MELNLKRPLLFFDIESTGLNIPADSIIELSFVKVFPGGEQRIKTWKVKPWDYELGRQSGQMAAKVLKGEAKASDIPFETVSEYGIYKNTDALNEMGVTIPDALNERAIEANEEA